MLRAVVTVCACLLWACEAQPRYRGSSTSTAPQIGRDTAPAPPVASRDAPPPDVGQLVGVRYGAHTGRPRGLAPFAGWLILPERKIEFAFRITDAYYGSARVLLLEHLYRRDPPDDLLWEVVAVLTLPSIPPGYTLVRGTCTLTDRADGSILAVARADVERGAAYGTLTDAWRADLEARRFREIPVSGLRCLNKPFDGR